MLPIHEVKFFLKFTPEPLQDIVLELRNIIAEAASDAVEVIRWKGISYLHEGRGGVVSAGICQIGLHEGYIRLDFIHGAFLSDPKKLLEGNQKAKRFIKIKLYEEAPWEDLKQLIEESSRFDPRSSHS